MSMKILATLVLVLVVAMSAQAGNHIVLNGSTQYLSGTTPASGGVMGQINSRMTAARIGHGTDQVLFDWTTTGILYIKAVSVGVTNLQFVPASGTGTATINISAFTSGFIYRFQYNDIGPNMAYILEVWDPRGSPESYVYSTVTASVSSIDHLSKAFRIGAKQDATLHAQIEIDFFRWSGFYYHPGEKSPFPLFAEIECEFYYLDYPFENSLANLGAFSATLTATGSPTYAANANTAPTAVGENVTVAKGRIPLFGTRSYDYEGTEVSDTLSSNWTCISAPGAGCGALTIRSPTRLFTWVDGATATGAYTFSFGVTDGTATDTDSSVVVTVVALSASIGDVACYVDEPCPVDASASAGWDTILVDTGETIPGSSLHYTQNIAKSVHRYHSAGVFTRTVTAYDAQTSPTSAQDTGTATVTTRAEADGANTEDLSNAGNANYISPANCTGAATGNLTKVQNAVNIAKARNTVAQKIILPAGCRADGQVTLMAPVGSAMITITTSGTLPVSHKRIVPATDAAQMFTIRTTATNTSAITTDTAAMAHHYKLRGLIFESSASQLGGIVVLGTADTELDIEDDPSEIPHDFIVQHCIVRPTSEFSVDVKNGIIFNVDNVSIIDNYIGPLSLSGGESHGINSWAAAGNHVVSNNFISAGAVNLFYGGALSKIHGQVLSNIEIRENYLWKDPLWRNTLPGWDGKARAVKNIFELKTGSNLVAQGNKLENNWGDAQIGFGILLQATCDSGNWATANDVDFSYNYMLNSELGVVLRGTEFYTAVQARRFTLKHDLFEGLIDRAFFVTRAPEVRISHGSFLGPTAIRTTLEDGQMRNAAFIYEDSITYNGAYGWFGSGTGSGMLTLNTYFPGHIMRNSLAIGGTAGEYPSVAPNTGWQFPANEAAVGFTNAAGSVWSLAGGSTYEDDASDGTDPGVNWADLQSHISHAVDGDWTVVSTTLPNVRGRIQGKGITIWKH